MLEAVPARCAGGAVRDHAGDLRGRTWILRGAVCEPHVVRVAVVQAGVVLHEARVDDAAVGDGRAHAAAGFLHYDGEDEAVVDAGGGGDAEGRLVVAESHGKGKEDVLWMVHRDVDVLWGG